MRQYLISQLPSILHPGEAVQAAAEVLAEVHQAAALAVGAAGAGNKPSCCKKVGAGSLRSPAMQHDFTIKDQSGDCIGSEFLTRGAVPVSEVSLVLQAGHFHHIHPSLMTPYVQR
jgi:hypothetical protein